MARLREIKMFSDEQVERANRVDVVDYVKSLGYEIERSGKWYKAKGQGGLYFNRSENTWHWHTGCWRKRSYQPLYEAGG